MCRHVYRHVYRHKRRHIDINVDMCRYMCIKMCIDMYIDMCRHTSTAQCEGTKIVGNGGPALPKKKDGAQRCVDVSVPKSENNNW